MNHTRWKSACERTPAEDCTESPEAAFVARPAA